MPMQFLGPAPNSRNWKAWRVFGGSSESLGIKLLWVLPGIGVMVHDIYGNHNPRSFGNVNAV